MGFLRETGKYRVPFEFHGEIVHLKVTKYTTFNDVVHMLTSKAGISKSAASMYAVYECTWDLERKIGGVVRVVAIWRSWGSEMGNFRFVVKQIIPSIAMKKLNNSPASHTERDVDRLFSNMYRELESSNSDNSTETANNSVKLSLKSFNKSNALESSSISFANAAFHLSRTERGENSRTSMKSKTSRMRQFMSSNEKVDKKAMLSKYFNGMKLFSSKSKLGKREKGDGSEYPQLIEGRHVEGCDSSSDDGVASLEEKFIASLEHCRYHWEQHVDSDTDSELSDDQLYTDSDSDDDSFVCSREEPVLDIAFVKSSHDNDSDEGIDVTSLNSNDLNTAFVEAFQQKCAMNTYTSENDDVVEFEKNISTCDYVRRIFGDGEEDSYSVGSQDEELDSFMRTRLDSF